MIVVVLPGGSLPGIPDLPSMPSLPWPGLAFILPLPLLPFVFQPLHLPSFSHLHNSEATKRDNRRFSPEKPRSSIFPFSSLNLYPRLVPHCHPTLTQAPAETQPSAAAAAGFVLARHSSGPALFGSVSVCTNNYCTIFLRVNSSLSSHSTRRHNNLGERKRSRKKKRKKEGKRNENEIQSKCHSHH